MTQALTNNLKNLEQMMTAQPANKPVQTSASGMDSVKNTFETKLDKAFSTINDIKQKLTSGDKQEALKDFKQILSQTTDEVNVETSLDLTLARDITEIPVTEDTADEETEVLFEQLLTFVDKTAQALPQTNLVQTAEEESVVTETNLDSSEVIDLAENTADEVISKSAEEKQIDDLESLLDEDMLKDLNVESIQADADTSGGDSFMQRQTPEESALKAIINNQSVDSGVKFETVQNAQQAKPVDVNPARILDQITKQIEGLQNNSKVNIVLNPESLGKVNIQLINTKEGLTAQFTVTTQEARDLIMKGLDGLKDTLISHGVGVDNISVKISDSQKSEYNSDWTEQEGSNGGNKEQNQPDREEKEKGLFEKMMAETTEKENGNV